MANNIDSILNVAGNWWKGLPAPVYYDMYENDSDFDDAVLSFEARAFDEFDDVPDDMFDSADIYDDEFAIEKVIYQMDKPDVMTTPYGDPVPDDYLAMALAEYPGIEAFSASPDDIEGDDYYDDDMWDDYFHYADVFLEKAGDEIDAFIEAVETKTASEGKMGEEAAVYSAVGDQIAASTQGEIDTALPPGTGTPFGPGQFTDMVSEETEDGDEGWVEKALDMGKDVLSSVTDMFNNPLAPQELYAGTETPENIAGGDSIDAALGAALGSATGTETATSQSTSWGEPLKAGGEQAAKSALEQITGFGEGAATDDDQTFWGKVASGLDQITGVEPSGQTGLTAASMLWNMGGLDPLGQKNQMSVEDILAAELFEPDPFQNYDATIEEVLQQLQGQSPDLIAALVRSPEFQAQAKNAGWTAETVMSKILEASGQDATNITDLTATPSLDAVTKRSLSFGEGAETALQDTVATPITPTTTTATTAATTPKTDFEKGAEGALTPVTAADKDWGEDLRKAFYTKMYARPGSGMSQVARELPNLYSQTRTLFLMEHGARLSEAISEIEAEGTNPDRRQSLRQTMEKEYDVFLDSYLANPQQYRTGNNFRRLSGEISRILRKEQDEPNRELWSNTDQQKLVWVRGLFGEESPIGYENRRNLVNLSLTNGGAGYYSQQIHKSADKLAQYYRNIGWTEADIFRQMTSLRGGDLEQATQTATATDAATATQTQEIQTPFVPPTPTDTTLSKPLQKTLGVGDPNYYDNVPYGFLQAKANALQKQDMAPSDLPYEEYWDTRGTPMATMGSAGGMVVPIEATPQPAQLPFQRDLWLAQYLAELENTESLSPLEEAELRPFLNKPRTLPTFMTE